MGSYLVFFQKCVQFLVAKDTELDEVHVVGPLRRADHICGLVEQAFDFLLIFQNVVLEVCEPSNGLVVPAFDSQDFWPEPLTHQLYLVFMEQRVELIPLGVCAPAATAILVE